MSLPLSTSAVASLFPPLAHQGGWDEILLVVAPLAIIGLLLYVANRRVNTQLEQARDTAESATGADPGAEPAAESDIETAETSESKDSSA